MKSVHIKVLSDNTTAVAYINNMGGTESSLCNDIASKMGFFRAWNEIFGRLPSVILLVHSLRWRFSYFDM